MNQDKEKLLTVGELARKSGVTVRTLQYYDKMGLLVPSEGGRRMYGRRNIIHLQQILFLKTFGFSLEEIRDRMLLAESVAELEQLFKQQKEVLLGQLSRIQEAINLTDKVIDEIHLGNEIGIDRLLAMMEATRLDNPYSFMIRHLSQDQMDYFFQCFENEETAFEFNKNLQALSAELIELYDQDVDPKGFEAQQLAAKWWEMIMSLTQGDPALIQNIFAIGTSIDNWPSEELKEATKSFLGEAISTYLNTNKIPLPFHLVENQNG